MDRAALRTAVDAQLREPDGQRVGPVVRQVSTGSGGWDGITWSDLDEQTADAAIAEQVDHFARLGRGFEWKLYGHDRPADLSERLRAAGFVAGPAETVLVASAAEVPRTDPPAGTRIVEVTDAAGFAQVEAVHDAAFGVPHPGLAASLAGPVAAGTTVAVVVLADGEPVSAARLELHPGTGFASLWGGGTVPAWRGRGLYRATVAHRAADAVARGHRHLRTDALPTSRPVLERLGFVAVTTTIPFVHA